MRFVIRGGTVVDGTGAPGRRADVLVQGDRIVAVGAEVERTGAEEVRADGMVVAPGFIDVHTHYDAQILWDRDLTPSSWHGVTTVVMGNCGFGIAPTRPNDREMIVRILENVEGMSVAALQAGIPWTFETFPEYLAAIAAAPLRINAGALIGHTPLRLYVMGDEVEQPASTSQIETMRGLVSEALECGALGFATSRSPNHQGAWGRPVPSRYATEEEVFEVASALHAADRGVAQVTPGSGFATAELARLALALNRPLTWTALLAGPGDPRKVEEILDRTEMLGGEVWPQVACRPVVMQVTLADPITFAMLPSFAEVLKVPVSERSAIYADEAWRKRARIETDGTWRDRWHNVSVQETEHHGELSGISIDKLAESRGVHPLDVMADLSIDDGLATRFRVVVANQNEELLARILADRRTLLGLSDAGAHASQLCDASFSSHLLEYWVRERSALSLEFAIWRLTGHPAEVFRLIDRGQIAPSLVADLVVFDPESIGVEEMERVYDLPGGSDRLVAQSRGIHHIFVNGVPIRRDGVDVPGRPGVLIRGTGA